jgi:hypothetical protein
MSIDQIIKMGEKIIAPDLMSNINTNLGLMLIFLLFCVIMSALGCLMFGATGAMGGFLLGILISLIVFGSGIVGKHNYDDALEKYLEDVEEWSVIANLYVSSLPKEKKEVVYIKIDPELGDNVSLWSSNIDSSEIKRTPITASFIDGDQIVTETQWFETTMELTDEEKPYIEYQALTKDLGHGINAGIYNAKIHLPRSYRFGEIK